MTLFLSRRRPEDSVADPRADAVIDRAALRGGRERRTSDRAGASFWNSEPAASVSTQRLAGDHIILRELHANEVRRDVQHDRRVGLIAMHRLVLTFEQVAHAYS